VKQMEWDWKGAIESLEQAMALDPEHPRAAHVYAYTMLLVNRPEKAVAAMKRALELDPLSLIVNADVAEILDFAGYTDEAIRQARHTIEMDSNFAVAHYALWRVLHRQGRDHEALQERLKADELTGLPRQEVEALRAAAAVDGWRGYHSKRVEQLTAALERGQSARFYEIGRLYAMLGKSEEAFEWFDRAYEQHDATLVNLGIEAPQTLRDDPRFRELQRKMGLPEQGLQVSLTH
jgi:tetratricopeptide (TPR) repeat protein